MNHDASASSVRLPVKRSNKRSNNQSNDNGQWHRTDVDYD